MVHSRLMLTRDLAGGAAQVGVNPTLEGRALQHAILAAIANLRSCLTWDVDHAGWLVFLHHPDEETFHGRTLEEAQRWCLVWLMAPELGIGISGNVPDLIIRPATNRRGGWHTDIWCLRLQELLQGRAIATDNGRPQVLNACCELRRSDHQAMKSAMAKSGWPASRLSQMQALCIPLLAKYISDQSRAAVT